jgi:spermidine synthase
MTTEDMKWFREIDEDAQALSYRIEKHLHHSRSRFQTIDVYETSAYGNLLVLDGCIMLTEAHEFLYHEMLVHVPMLSHPRPEKVLVIGGGDGGSVREVLKHDVVAAVDMVEIDEEVVEVSRKYLPSTSSKLDDPKVTLIFQDAVEYIRETGNEYDVVLVDSTDPIGPGEGLFNQTFYRDVFKALRPRGIVVVQSESPFQLSGDAATIQAKLKSVFPLVKLYLGPVPCYPYGTWSYTYCSRSNDAPEMQRPAAARLIEADCKYYNRKIHDAAFVLPNFLKKLCASRDQ